MNKTTKGLIAVLAVGAVVFFVYKKYGAKKLSKIDFAQNIATQTGRAYTEYMGLEESYLKARSDAYDKGEGTFSYNSKQYSTSTGKAVA